MGINCLVALEREAWRNEFTHHIRYGTLSEQWDMQELQKSRKDKDAFSSTCFGASSNMSVSIGCSATARQLQSASIQIARDVFLVRIYSKDFSNYASFADSKSVDNDKWNCCMSTIEFFDAECESNRMSSCCQLSNTYWRIFRTVLQECAMPSSL